MRSLMTILITGSVRTQAGCLVLIAALTAEVGLAQMKAYLPQPVVAGNLISAGDTSNRKTEPLAPGETRKLATQREVLSKDREAEAFPGFSGQIACAYRDGFHVPAQLRKGGEPFQWGVLGLSMPVRLRVRDKVSSSHAEAGDRIELEVVEDVLVKGYPVIRKGVEAWGVITSNKRPGVGGEWIVYDRNPRSPEPLFGHNGEFPMLLFHGGRLNFQVEGVYDVTGGEVPLHATDVVRGADTSPADPYNLGIVLAWEALRSPLQKLSGKHVHSLAGSHAVLRKGTEIKALVDAAVCYDVAFLGRIRELELIEAHENGKAEEAIRHAMSDVGKATSSSAPEQAPDVSDFEAAHRSSTARPHVAAPHASATETGELVSQAAQQGDAREQSNLGAMHEKGVPKSQTRRSMVSQASTESSAL